jgi:hypothetical protein
MGECTLQLQKTIEDFDARALTIKSVKRDVRAHALAGTFASKSVFLISTSRAALF